MLEYSAKRLLQAIPVVIITTIVVFLVLRLTPGDPAAIMAGAEATPEQVNTIRRELGLDQPIVWQYVGWVKNLLAGDLGKSYIVGRPVSSLIGTTVAPTLELNVVALLISLVVGVPVGVLGGLKPGSIWEAGLNVISALVMGIPMFLLALIYLLLFALLLLWLPAGGYADLFQKPAEGWRFLLLPALTLGLPNGMWFARFVRTALIDVLGMDYVRTAYAKGLSPSTVITRHALRNALLPLVTVLGIQFGRQLAGTVVVEQVFAWPGMGRLALIAIQTRDYVLFQAIILLLVLAAVVINLLTDLSYGFLDPRTREAG
ncbi:MAG: ABC transporter permease [Bacteroidetes bacterium]|nr:ABC transporter permease [Bacteroidota bacterium]